MPRRKINIQEKVADIFKRHELYHDYSIISPSKVEVEVVWGDWKHEHGALTQFMNLNGFRQIDERVTEEDGSDCYSSVHTYQLKQYCK